MDRRSLGLAMLGLGIGLLGNPLPLLAAGNVTAQIKGGSLVIKGDAKANDIEVDQAALPPDMIRIQTGASATSINGVLGPPVVLSGFTKDVKVDLGKGANAFLIDGVAIPGSLSHAGDGGGSLTLDDVEVQKNLQVKSGKSGALDTVMSTGAVIHGKTKIDLQGDGSVIDLNIMDALKGISIKTRDGSDDVDFHDVEGGGSVVIKLGSGGSDTLMLDVDFEKDMKVTTGDAVDWFATDAVMLGGRFQANLGSDDAHLNLVRITTGKGIRILAKDGSHTIMTDDANTSGKLQLKASGEMDLDYVNSFCGDAQIKLGNGDDLVSIDDSVVMGKLKLFTGNGLNQTSFENGAGVVGKTLIKGGNQGDQVFFQIFGFLDDVAIQLGPGFGNFSVQPPCCGAHIIMGDLKVTAKGSDPVIVDINQLGVTGDIVLRTGNGDDSISFDEGGASGGLDIRTGAGNDDVRIETAASAIGPAGMDELRIDTGTGDDLVQIGEAADGNALVDVSGSATVDGGKGKDTLDEAGHGNGFDEGLDHKGFEIFP